MAIAIAGFNSAVLLSVRNRWGYVFNDDPGVVAGVAAIIPYVALFQLADGLGTSSSERMSEREADWWIGDAQLGSEEGS